MRRLIEILSGTFVSAFQERKRLTYRNVILSISLYVSMNIFFPNPYFYVLEIDIGKQDFTNNILEEL